MTSEPYASARRVFWVVDNGSSHTGRPRSTRMPRRPTATLVHLPVHASWLNQIEIDFSVIQRKVLTPADFADLDALANRLDRLRASLQRHRRALRLDASPAPTSTTCCSASTPTNPPRPPRRLTHAKMGRWRPRPPSTKTSLSQRLAAHARAPLARPRRRRRPLPWRFRLHRRHLPDGDVLPLCRLRYGGSANHWGFAIYRASHDDYTDSFLPNGQTAGSPEEALDCACGLYIGGPSTHHRRTERTRPLVSSPAPETRPVLFDALVDQGRPAGLAAAPGHERGRSSGSTRDRAAPTGWC